MGWMSCIVGNWSVHSRRVRASQENPFMLASIHPLLIQWLTSLAAVFFIVDPFAATPTFLAIPAGCDRSRRKGTARRAALTCFALLVSYP